MSDLIKRQDAIDALNECEDIKGHSYTQMHDALMEIPSADRPQGDWIDRGMRVPSSWVKKCSLCGHETDTWRWCKFCPNCGAKMSNASNASNTLETLETLEKGETE